MALVSKLYTAFIYLKSTASFVFWDWWHKRILLLNFTGNAAHLGCIATSKALVGLIRDKYRGCALRFQAIDFHPIKANLEQCLVDLDATLPQYLKLESDKFKFFRWAQIIILNGEGSMHEYKNKEFNQFFLNKLIQVYAAKKFFGKTVFAVNQSIEYENNDFTALIKQCLQKLDYLCVREINSFVLCKKLGLSNTTLASDAAFLTQKGDDADTKTTMEQLKLKEGFIAVFLSETIKECNYVKIRDLLKEIRKISGLDMLLCPAARSEMGYFGELNCSLNLPILNPAISPEEMISLLTHASVIMSGRFHACIFAFLAEKPVLPFCSNSFKIEGLMKLMNYETKVFNYANDTNVEIIDGLKKILLKSNELAHLIAAELPRVKSLAILNMPQSA